MQCTTDTLQQSMQELKIANQFYDRRKFLLASSAVVVGAMTSCGGISEPAKRIVSTPYAPVDIRVRIGKQVTSVVMGNLLYTKKTVGNTPRTVVLKEKTEILIHKKAKLVSGVVVFYPNKNKETFDVVAHIPIEHYLPGVLAGELYAHWHPATYAAQAVAARSYAINHHYERKNTSHFDVSDGTSSQMFLGDVTLDVAHRAVQETKGVVLRWENRVIPAYYSACCGGLAATAHDAITHADEHNITPLKGHSGADVCASTKGNLWATQRKARLLRQRLNACAQSMRIPKFADIKSIRSVEPSATNQHGRPTKLMIVDRQKNTFEVSAKSFMRGANTKIAALPNPQKPLWSSFLVAEKDGENLMVNGRGMGHGVGLCQYGAQELAGRGESWENILAWYYPQAQITM